MSGVCATRSMPSFPARSTLRSPRAPAGRNSMRWCEARPGWAAMAAFGGTVGFWLPRDVERFMEQPIFHVGTLPVTPWFLVKSLVYLLFVGMLARATGRFL